MRPIIGITCNFNWEDDSFQLRSGYVEGVRRAGGLPFLIPPFICKDASDLLNGVIRQIHGLLLSGGQDVHPRYFGEEPHIAIGRVNPLRDEMELSLSRLAVKAGIPVFGICRGVQLLNIALGGDIYQDLNAQAKVNALICHDQPAPKWFGFHDVTIQEGSRLHEILGKSLLATNSFHHQSVRNPAPGLRSVAFTSDGIVEAVESRDHPFLIGVQWHPECMLENMYMLRLFEAFVDSAGHCINP